MLRQALRVALAAVALLAVKSFGSPPDNVAAWRPLWKVQADGFSGEACVRALTKTNCAGLAFTGDGGVVIYTVFPVAPKLRSGVGAGAGSSAFKIGIRVRDPKSAVVRAERQFYTVTGHSFGQGNLENTVRGTKAGILLQIGDTLHAMTGGLTDRKVWRLPVSEGPGDPASWYGPTISVSPSRATIFVTLTANHNGTFRVCPIDSASLERAKCLDQSSYLAAQSDTTLVSVAPGGSATWFQIAELDGTDARPFPMPRWADLDGMTDDGHFLYTCCGKSRRERDTLVLGSLGGETRTVYRTGSKDESLEAPPNGQPLQVSQDGRLVAWLSRRVHRGSSWFDTFDKDLQYRVLVLDLGAKKLRSATPWAKVPKYVYDFALSPDGQYLAVMADGEVAMYHVPASGLP